MGLYTTSCEGGDALSGNLFGIPHYQAIFLGTIALPAAPAQDHGEPLVTIAYSVERIGKGRTQEGQGKSKKAKGKRRETGAKSVGMSNIEQGTSNIEV